MASKLREEVVRLGSGQINSCDCSCKRNPVCDRDAEQTNFEYSCNVDYVSGGSPQQHKSSQLPVGRLRGLSRTVECIPFPPFFKRILCIIFNCFEAVFSIAPSAGAAVMFGFSLILLFVPSRVRFLKQFLFWCTATGYKAARLPWKLLNKKLNWQTS
jgi:hypothetical protein